MGINHQSKQVYKYENRKKILKIFFFPNKDLNFLFLAFICLHLLKLKWHKKQKLH